VAIAAITVAELRVGVELSEGGTRTRRQEFVDDVVAAVPVLSYDLDVAAVHAALLVAVRRQGIPRGAHDLIIAATAKASNRIVVTADTTAFRDLPDISVRGHR
jgi:tRNA(fMet)-specific endonuclease VapC